MNSLTTKEQLEQLIIAKYPDQTDYWLCTRGKGKHTPIILAIKCPRCGHESEITIKNKTELRNLVQEECPRCLALDAAENAHLEFPMPFGKHCGKSVNEVMKKDPTYLAWFVDNIKGRDNLVAQIKTHSRFAEAWDEYLANPKIPKEQREAREWHEGKFSQQTIDELFNAFFEGMASH